MTDTMLPILRQMHDAADDRGRALILLQVSDAVLMKYRDVFEAACRRAGFEGGLAWIDIRRAAYLAVRGPDGRLNNPLFEQARQDFAAFAGASDEGGESARAQG